MSRTIIPARLRRLIRERAADRCEWDDHFDLASDGTLAGTTPAGRTTIRLLQLNRPERIEERQLLIAAKLWTHPTDG